MGRKVKGLVTRVITSVVSQRCGRSPNTISYRSAFAYSLIFESAREVNSPRRLFLSKQRITSEAEVSISARCHWMQTDIWELETGQATGLLSANDDSSGRKNQSFAFGDFCSASLSALKIGQNRTAFCQCAFELELQSVQKKSIACAFHCRQIIVSTGRNSFGRF